MICISNLLLMDIFVNKEKHDLPEEYGSNARLSKIIYSVLTLSWAGIRQLSAEHPLSGPN